jgi:hypothetical protein
MPDSVGPQRLVVEMISEMGQKKQKIGVCRRSCCYFDSSPDFEGTMIVVKDDLRS